MSRLSTGSSVEKVEGLMREELEPGEGREAVIPLDRAAEVEVRGAINNNLISWVQFLA